MLLLTPGRSKVGISVRDGVAVGHTQAWDIDGRSLSATTLSLRPLAFEIPDFLDASECDLLQSAANRLGMHRSETKAQAGAPASALDAIDADENGMLDLDELRLTVEHWHDVSLDRKQASGTWRRHSGFQQNCHPIVVWHFTGSKMFAQILTGKHSREHTFYLLEIALWSSRGRQQ